MRKSLCILLIIMMVMACIIKTNAQDDIKSNMLQSVNELRQTGCRCGKDTMPPVPALLWNTRLEKAATRHAKDMQKNELTAHSGSDGSLPDERISDAGYEWETCGENVAWGFYTVQEVMESWKGSQGHCRNLMHAKFTELGAAKEGSYWVQEFGRPKTENKKSKSPRR